MCPDECEAISISAYVRPEHPELVEGRGARDEGNGLILAAGLLTLACLSCAALAVWAYIELPRQGWKTFEACAGLAAGVRRAGVCWTSPISSAAPAAAFASRYALCGRLPWPPWLATQGNRTFPFGGPAHSAP